MKKASGFVGFLYGTAVGRCILKGIICLHLDRVAVWFLRSHFSRLVIGPYAKRNGISLTKEEKASFKTYREFFVRTREPRPIDRDPDHLVSPCDGWLSVFDIDDDRCFDIKNSHYRVADFLQDTELAAKYRGGTLLVFRLCASDYHHYSYVDDGYVGENHHIDGILHSVQPIACENFPIYVLNRRSWCLLNTDHFGDVVQCEIGALVVGGIENEAGNKRICKGDEKGRFELAGSTIVLLVEPGKIEIRPEILQTLSQCEEARVTQGMWVASAKQMDENK